MTGMPPVAGIPPVDESETESQTGEPPVAGMPPVAGTLSPEIMFMPTM